MISVENLNFTFPGSATPVLHGLSLQVSRAEVYGLLGPSGAGKSTTQRILLGLEPGYTGQATILGQPANALKRSYYGRIGVSFELPALYLRLTARENLALFGALYEGTTRSPDDLLALVDLSDAADMRVSDFSKGMKMRLNLCRALVNDPELVFLDEPTSGQDPARARVTRDLIKTLKSEGRTVFLTTHNMAEAAEICDRVGFLVDGRIPVTGSPDDLMRRFGEPLVEVKWRKQGTLDHARFPLAGMADDPDFITALKSPDLVSIHTLEAGLDDVFIAVAGQREG
ncbi:ABC transporter ATP-binding protein [Cucumibacter marinus]|uniref:ABC transporter ATP-binding protein n=1 Tax=Cucumibacter marinus TaxID=1121252 RepID=UPI000401633F|nr:ABC transporter ATP-binding protein [Cucumibacter marinus]